MGSNLLDSAPLLARGALWSLVSVGFIDPFHRERLELLSDGPFREQCLRASALLKAESPATKLGPGEMPVEELSPQSLFAAYDAERQTLEKTYRSLFGLTAFSEHCPACEIEYLPNPDPTFRSQHMADVAGFYRAFGMRVSPRGGERADHLTIETEFLHLLSVKEAVARLGAEGDAIAVCREARRKFYEEHLGWWLPVFSTLLCRREPPGFYRALARLAASLAALERESLELPPFDIVPFPSPSRDETKGTCFDCVGGGQNLR